MKQIKFRQPIFVKGKFDRFHYWGFKKDGHFIGPENLTIDIHQSFTGLLDKKGKEIYEGDIVKMADWNSPAQFRSDTSYHRIYWDDEGARWWDERLEDGDSLSGYQDYCIDWVSDGIVIGNIYANPELLTP